MPAQHTLSPLPSGLAPADAAWGGLWPGGTYLLVGHADVGRGRLVLDAVQSATPKGLSVLVSPRTPEVLIKQAQEAGFDLRALYRDGSVKLLRAPSAADLAGLDDAALANAYTDLGQLARAHRPVRLTVDDFTALLRFQSFDAFAAAFRSLTKEVASLGTNLVLGLGEPANDASSQLLAFLRAEAAGTLHVHRNEDGSGVALTLVPGTLHVGGPRTLALESSDASAFTEAPLEVQSPSSDSPSVPDGNHSDQDASPKTISSDADPFYGEGSDGYSGNGHVAVTPPDLVVPVPPTPVPAENVVSEPVIPEQASPEEALAPVQTEELVSSDAASSTGELGSADEKSSMEDSGDAMPWAPITPINPAMAPFDATQDDTFGINLGPDLLALGHFVDSDVSGATAPPAPTPIAAPIPNAPPTPSARPTNAGPDVHAVASLDPNPGGAVHPGGAGMSTPEHAAYGGGVLEATEVTSFEAPSPATGYTGLSPEETPHGDGSCTAHTALSDDPFADIQQASIDPVASDALSQPSLDPIDESPLRSPLVDLETRDETSLVDLSSPTTIDSVTESADDQSDTSEGAVSADSDENGLPLAETATAVHAAAYPELFADAPAASPAQAMRATLKKAFANRQEHPFLVLALRLNPRGSFSDLLPALAEGLDAALNEDAALYGDPDLGGLIALLPNSNADDAQGLLAALKSHLHMAAPERAANAMAAVNALVAPNGSPFDSADKLLDYVFSG